MGYLIVREPGQVAFLVELSGELTAGRDPANVLVLHDGQVSRRHVRVEPVGAGWRVCDLGSTHGTRVNGELMTGARPLADGDVVQVGGVVLVYRDGTAPHLGGPGSIVRTITEVVEPPERPAGADARRLRVLFDVGRVIGALGDPERAIERVLDMTLDVLACERGLVGLVDGGRAIGRRIARARGDAGLDDLAVGGAALAAIVERRESVLCRDPGAPAAAPGSAMGAPLVAGGRVLGFLYVDDRARAQRFGPDDLDFLSALARLAAAALDQAEAHRRATAVVETVEVRGVAPLLGDSEPMRRLRAQIERCAASDVAVLIRGETGTGKELVAGHVHARSPRAGQPFVAVNCAAIPDNLIESELFGYHKGAFTGADRARRGRFACAHRGTLFLDEIGDLGLAAQAKLLRAIEEGEIHPVGAEQPVQVDVRVVAASHKDLAAEVAAGRFREDLFYRLDVVELEVPPLRVRGDDVLLLADHFCDEAAQRLGRPRLALAPAARAALRAYGWPGNVRQLQHELERALLLAEGAQIEAADLRLRGAATAAPPGAGLAERYADAERAQWDAARDALARTGGDAGAAARLLGVTAAWLERTLARDPDPTVLAGGDGADPDAEGAAEAGEGSGEAAGPGAEGPAEAGPAWRPIEDAERQLLERALRANGGNIRATARALGVARATLYRKIAKYGLA